MSYKEDRVYVFMTAALHRNSRTSRKYFFDEDDNTLFLLQFEDGRYSIDEQIPQIKTDVKVGLLESKIRKLLSENSRVHELKRLENAIEIPYSKEKRTTEEFERLWNLGQEQFKLTHEFMERIGIDATKVTLIE